MKKALTTVLCTALVMSSLAGCGNKSGASTASSSDNTSAASEGSVGNNGSGNDSGEITNIIWQYPSTGNLGSGFQEVEDALNKMMEKDIGVHVTLEPVGLMDAQNQASLMVSAGEQLDISLTAFNSVGPLVESGLIYSLDDLIEKYGQDLKEQTGASLEGCKYNSEIYGVPPAYINSNTYGYAVRKDLLDKYGITVEKNKKYTLDDLEKIFETVKAGEGDTFYCTIPWNTTPDPLNNSYMEYDKVSGSLATGVLMLNQGFENLTLKNLFETEEYANYVNKMYDWAKKGYVSPDAAVTTEVPNSLLASGNYLGMFYWWEPDETSDLDSIIGYDMTILPMVDRYVANNGGSNIMWNIPTTSANPEKAMQALNYIYQNKEAAWLLQFGLEGKTYEVVDKTDDGVQIKYLSEDTSTLPYYQTYGVYGNRLEWPVVYPAPANKYKILKELDDSTPKERYSPALGYSFNQTSVSTELAAVTTVIDQYTPSFNSGALDPSKSLPEFIEALKAAGIDKIIQENQKQLDEWATIQ